MNGNSQTTKCRKCSGYIASEYGDKWCVNCGWREAEVEVRRIFTVTSDSNGGKDRHYDPDDAGDRKKIANFLKRCPGSDRVAYFMGKKVRCNYCHRVTYETMQGRARAHLPAAWFAEKVKEAIAEYVYNQLGKEQGND